MIGKRAGLVPFFRICWLVCTFSSFYFSSFLVFNGGNQASFDTCRASSIFLSLFFIFQVFKIFFISFFFSFSFSFLLNLFRRLSRKSERKAIHQSKPSQILPQPIRTLPPCLTPPCSSSSHPLPFPKRQIPLKSHGRVNKS